MLASVHVADVGLKAITLRAPKPKDVAGLRTAQVGVASRLGPSLFPALQPKRAVLMAFWDDEAALDAYVASDPKLLSAFADGWSVRLEPLRVHGEWPGVPDDLPRARKVESEGPVVVLTLAKLKVSQALRFFRTTAIAEERLQRAGGLVWAMGFGKPPFLATCSAWESADDAVTYAYGDEEPAHPDAIAAQRSKDFHRESAFIRFRPFDSVGSLGGKDPLAADWMSVARGEG